MHRSRSRFLAILLIIGMSAAACGSATVGDAGPAAPGQPVEGGSTDHVACTVPAEDGPDGQLAEQVASSPAEDVPSALFDRRNALFPEPLVDLDRIISGGPPPDGIRPIDEPHFVPVARASHVAACEPVVVLELDGQARAYPIHVMTRHEIVNDAFGEVPVAVTYCPLCSSAIAYDRRVDGRVLDFGTSGSLYNSALVMYDRQTESLWSHFNGQAVVGHLTGAELDVFPMATVSFSSFAEAHPEGLVLTRNTGVDLPYGSNPYVGYDTVGSQPFLFDGVAPDDFAAKERFIGVELDGEAVALRHRSVMADGVMPFTVGEQDLVAWILPGTPSPLVSDTVSDGPDIGASGVFVPEVDGQQLTFARSTEGFVDEQTGTAWDVLGRGVSGELSGRQLEPIAHVDTFWFAWTAFHPETAVVG